MSEKRQLESGIFPIGTAEYEELLLAASLHTGWQRLKAALRGAGVAPNLMRQLAERLGEDASKCPTPERIYELLDGHFRGVGRGRASEGRWVAHREGDRVSARHIVARLRTALPELGVLTLADERHDGQPRVVLRMAGGHTVVEPDEVGIESLGGGRYVRRTVTVDGLVRAANRLLAMRGARVRLLPIEGPEDADAYLGVSPEAAELLDRVGFWAEPLGHLAGFASWTPGDAFHVA